MQSEKAEKLILKISLISGIIFVTLELFMALYSKSQSILMDTAFDASELIVIAASLLLTPLLFKPVTEKRPFGYAQCESLFIIVKGFMLIAVTLSLISSNMQVMINGGNHIDTNLVFMFELSLSILSLIVLVILKHYGKSLHSPMIIAEIYGWKVDVVCGLGVSVAFLVPPLLEKTPIEVITPYFDQIIAIILAVLMLPEPIKMVVRAFKDILLFAPNEETVFRVRELAEPICEQNNLEIVFIDLLQTGRRTWIAITVNSQNTDWCISQLKAVDTVLTTHLQIEFEDVFLELIPSLD